MPSIRSARTFSIRRLRPGAACAIDLSAAICASRLWRATSFGNCPSVNTWKWRRASCRSWFSSLANRYVPNQGKRVWSPPLSTRIRFSPVIFASWFRWPGRASRAGHGDALTSRSFLRERAVQRNKRSAYPHVSGGKPVGLHRIEAGTSSGEIGWISRKVSFHVAHSFRSEEAQFWVKTCGREPDSNAIFLTQCLDAKSDLAKFELA